MLTPGSNPAGKFLGSDYCGTHLAHRKTILVPSTEYFSVCYVYTLMRLLPPFYLCEMPSYFVPCEVYGFMSQKSIYLFPLLKSSPGSIYLL